MNVEHSRDSASNPPEGGHAREARVVALVNDLIFESRIAAVADALGAPVRIARTAEAVLAAISHAERLIVDLHAEAVDSLKLIKDARGARPDLEIIGIFSHVQIDRKKAAEQAGASRVLPRSVFVQRLKELLV